MNDKASKLGLWLRRGAAVLLSLMLVFSLIQPGLARADVVYICGKEAHTHSDDCYETKTQQKTVQVLKCSLAEAVSAASEEDAAPGYVHTHGESCYVGEVLVCPLKEVEAHTHGAECYGKEPQCGQEEVAAHGHSDACRKELTCTQEHEHTEECYTAKECTLEETEGHTHTAECYNLICEKPEIVLHEHDENCYAPMAADGEDKEPKLTCTTPEVIAHVHDGSCYEEKTEDVEVKSLICGLEEHTHTDACVQKPEEKKPAWTCGKEAHIHAEGCYDAENTLTCTLDEHTHTDACVQKSEEKKPAWTCGKEAHTHAEGCYDAENTLTCALEEHTHTDACAAKVEEQKPVARETYEKTLEDLLTRAEALSKEAADYETQWEAILKETEALRETLASDCEAGNISLDEYYALTGKVDEIENLYYADMEAATELKAWTTQNPEDIGPSDNDITTDSSGNIRIQLFDYSKYINKKSSSDGAEFRDNWRYFKFRGTYGEVENAANSSKEDSITTATYIPTLQKGEEDKWKLYDDDPYTINHATVKRVLDDDGYPIQDLSRTAIGNRASYDSVDDDVLNLGYLFSDGDHAVKAYTANNTLLKKTGNNYSYNSKNNAADFVPKTEIEYGGSSTGTFFVRNYAERTATAGSQGTAYGDFLPFNYTKGELIEDSDGKEPTYHVATLDADYWFGMTMEFSFVQTKDGKLKDAAGNEIPMTFSFSGDDDVWVFVDNVLVLDLGGTHGTVDGKINFATGEIAQYLSWDGATQSNVPQYENGSLANWPSSYPTTLKNCFEAAERTPVGGWKNGDGDIFADYTTHTLKFFYLERATAYANCKLDFNLETIPDNSLTIRKDVKTSSGDAVIAEDLKYQFRVMKQDESGPYIPEGAEYTIKNTSDYTTVGSGTVGGDGIFTLKAGQTAVFEEMIGYAENSAYGYIVQEILDSHTDKINAVKINDQEVQTKTDHGHTVVSSQVYQGDATVNVSFTNIPKVGHLSITKKVLKDGVKNSDSAQEFDIIVTLNGKPVPAGTAYADGKTVANGGIIKLKNGENATISNIMYGTEYIVREVQDSAKGYTVAYQKENGDSSNDHEKDKIAEGRTQSVTVVNEEKTITPTTTITKHIANPDGGKHTYTFNWWEVTSVNDETEPEAANKKTVTIENVEKSTESAQIPLTTVSTLDFVNENGTYDNTGSKVFYYRFVEVPDSTGKSVHDPAVYVVKLTVTNDNGTLSETREIYKNGTLLTGNASKMEFTNILLKDLTIEKKMGKDSENINNSGYLLNVVINSKHFRKGMEIKVKDTDKKVSIANDTTTSVTLTDISIGADKSVTISGIPYDSTYTITETNGYGYNATYKYSTETKVDNKTVGVMHSETPVGTVTNTNLSDAVTISGTKKVSNPDKHEHTFTFALEQVKDAEGTPLADTGKRHKDQSIDVKVSGQKADFSFGELTYETSDLAGGTVDGNAKVKTFYYMVTETTRDDWKTLDADETEFIVEVTLTGKQGALKAEITDILENDVSKGADYPIEFRNTLLGSLTVKKSVVGGGNPSDSFKFRLKLDKAHDGTYLAEQNDVDTTLTIKNGLAEFWLRRNEEITIYGLPHGLEVEVYEFDAEEYRAYHKIDTSLTRKGQTANAKVSTDGTTVKYINYDIDSEWLPQTGQLKWPVLVLAALGIGLLGFGALSRKRKRNGK